MYWFEELYQREQKIKRLLAKDRKWKEIKHLFHVDWIDRWEDTSVTFNQGKVISIKLYYGLN
jgi:hypothetical protein